jgi:phosphoribosylaminoimidazole (AIR) synthetase
VLRPPKGFDVVVHGISWNPRMHDLTEYSADLVYALRLYALRIKATPIGFANVIDASNGGKRVLEKIVKGLVGAANKHNLAIMNGELAILGSRVNCDANVCATMISIVPKGKIRYGISTFSGIEYAVFDPEGKAVYINSDGVGTKTEFYERARSFPKSFRDTAAMKWDDAIKLGATIKVNSEIVETKGYIPFDNIRDFGRILSETMGILSIMHHEHVGDRIRGYNDRAPSYNMSGSVVSVIDEERLKNPLKPMEGDYLIAIRSEPNPRSNGITAKRETMIKLFGNNWHKTREGKIFLEYLAEPSTVLYPVFKDLVDNNLATSVYHMSGGAYKGKLAKPLAKQDLFVKLENLFAPDWRELALAGASFTTAENAYAKWPMGNDGFIATNNQKEALRIIASYGLAGNVVGRIEIAKDGKTGVELKAFNGETVYFSGK